MTVSSAAEHHGDPHSFIVVNEPRPGWVGPDLSELNHHRELLWFLIWRDVKIRYKQTALGAAWAILQPLLTMAVFTLIFGRLARIGPEGLPYTVFSFCALVPWTFFSTAVTQASDSLVANEKVITKVYFPRLLLPAGAVAAVLVDFALAFVVLVGMVAFFGIAPTAGVLALPAFVLVAVAAALGVGLFFGALNVRYRDVRYIIPFLVQVWMFVTPVVYSSSLVPARWRFLYALNPMVLVVDGFRWAMLGLPRPSLTTTAASLLGTVALLGVGVYYFRRMEDSFADEV